MTERLAFGALVLAWMAFGSAAQASSINYGDFTGSSVMYLDVTETANSPGDEEPLFGGPGLTGNRLDFDPMGFSATAEDCIADLTDGQLNFTLMSMRENAIQSITLAESGDFTLLGAGSDMTQIGYGVAIASIVAVEVDGVALDTPIVLDAASASGGQNLGNGSTIAMPWSLSLDYDVNAALAAAGISFEFGATKLEIAIDNTLAAIAEPLSIASIAKKDFSIAVSVIPEPGTMVLVGGGLIGLGLRGRRKH